MTLTRSEFASDDVDVVRDAIGTAFADGLVIEAKDAVPFAFSQVAASDSSVTVVTMSFDGHVAATMDGSPQVLFTDIRSGRYEWRSRDASGDQDRPLIVPAHHELTVDFDTVRSVMVNVDAPTVSRWFARYGGLPPSPALLHQAVAGSDAIRQTVRFYGELMQTEAFESDLVRANLLDVLLSMTAHHLLPDGHGSDQRGWAPDGLRRAEQYLRAHAAEAISVGDAAEAARLSVRGLQDQFRRWLGLTPGQYLRNIRLENVRTDLLMARDAGRRETIGAVARRWGFAHAGRFSALYADAYGESPSATVRRR